MKYEIKTELPEIQWRCIYCKTTWAGHGPCPKCGPRQEFVTVEFKLGDNVVLKGKLEIIREDHDDLPF